MDQISLEYSFNPLGIEVRISTDCREIFQRLPDIAVHPNQAEILTGRLEYRIERVDGRYSIRWGGESSSPRRSQPEMVIIYLQELINYHFRMEMCPFPAIHSGSASLGGKAFILVGDKGAGKTTLIGKLLLSGADVHGDEYVLINGDRVIPYPRKFHLKPGTLALLPELAEVCTGLRPYPIDTGGEFFFFDPLDAGKGWKTLPMPLSAVFYLEATHGQRSSLDGISKIGLTQKVMHQVDNYPADPAGQIRAICRTINQTPSYLLRAGDLDQAVVLIKGALRI